MVAPLPAEGNPPRYFFKRENRVQKRADFLETYGRGKAYRRKLVHVFVLPRESADLPTRIGLTATRKIGKAVVRNRLKRQTREVFRQRLPDMQRGFTMIVNFTRSAAEAEWAQLESQLDSAWREAGLLPRQAGAAHEGNTHVPPR